MLEQWNLKRCGQAGKQVMLFAHGFGCNQAMWRHVAPAFEQDYEVVLFDLAGCGGSDPALFDYERHGRLEGYAQDVLTIIDGLGAEQVIFVGHSVSAMIGLLASVQKPSAIERLILIGPSPCYLNDGAYRGGFERAEIDGLLETIDANYLGWSQSMAPVIMGNAERPALASELGNSFCQTNPDFSRHFARAIFLGDNRKDLGMVDKPALIMQCDKDVIAPKFVGEYIHKQIPASELVYLAATGHCPNLSAPNEVISVMNQHLTLA